MIAILNLEPKYRNLALEKIRLYYIQKGYQVEDYFALNYLSYEKIYCSSIFTFTPKVNLPPNSICGGTGFNLETRLPPEIEIVKPHLNFGFTSRGCIRKCKFCVVPSKEGAIRVDGDLIDLWDGKAKDITLYDNNILALPEHFKLICEQAKIHNLRLDFNQGLDFRLLNQDNLDMLKSISIHELRFAFDDPRSLKSVDKAIDLLQKNGIRRCLWYVLCGFNTSFEDDLKRCEYLRRRNQNAFVQIYKNGNKIPHKLTQLARWANRHSWFQSVTWQEFLRRQHEQ